MLGVALGRVMAHEVRHQYVMAPHHAQDGLGADAPLIVGSKSYAEFSPTDQTDIVNALMQLERTQGKSTVIPMNPKTGTADEFPY